jgi:hypothetical protein
MLLNAGTKKCEFLSSRCILFAFVVTLIFSEFFSSGLLRLLVVAVEVHLPCPGQSASLGGGDIQSEQGRDGEATRRAQGAAQETLDRQARSK